VVRLWLDSRLRGNDKPNSIVVPWHHSDCHPAQAGIQGFETALRTEMDCRFRGIDDATNPVIPAQAGIQSVVA
jgi:hypothetical protein